MTLGLIRTRLLIALLSIMLISAVLVAAGGLVVLRADRDFRALAQDHIPRVALAGELAEVTSSLASLAAGILAGAVTTDSGSLDGLDAASAKIGSVLSAPSLQSAASRAALLNASDDFQSALASFAQVRSEMQSLELSMPAADQNLRWIHAEVQDQASALLQDLSFEMDAQLGYLVDNVPEETQRQAEEHLKQNQRLRDRLQRLATEAATLSALLLQARSSSTVAALESVEQLAHDTLDSIALARAELPSRSDVRLLMEGIDRLAELSHGEGGIFSVAEQHIGLRASLVVHLADAQSALADMQAHLTSLGRGERIAAQQAADTAAEAVLAGSLRLSLLTVLGILATSVVLILFVRNRILLRIEALSRDLIRIARGDLGAAPIVSGRDEITRLAGAVETFRVSTEKLQAAHRELSTEVFERRRTVKKLERAQRELVQAGKMAALGQMSAAISHEINQPLAAMRHRLHALRTSGPEVSQAVDRIEGLVARISATINHLRRIARRSDHRHGPVLLADPLNAALDLLEHRLAEANVTVVRPTGLSSVVVAGDEILLEQVMLNVLTNAIDAIVETGRGSGTIILEQDVGNPISLYVRDDGVGLQGHAPADLIDPFFTTKEVGRGLGLGLSITYNVMQDMGGGLRIGSGPNGGAEICLQMQPWQEAAAEMAVEHA